MLFRSIGAGARVVAGVIIGAGAAVGEGGIVYYNVPPGYFVASPLVERKKKLIKYTNYEFAVSAKDN